MLRNVSASLAPNPGRGPTRRAVGWGVAVTLLVLVAWPFAPSPLVDLETLRTMPGAQLARPPLYLLLAPVCDVMDALTLLGVRQTLALIGALAVVYVVWRTVRWRRRGTRLLRELRLALRALGALVAFYGLGILAPRPMAKLVLDDPALVAVDVHSHTNWSHDGRVDFTAARNLAWHRAAGFDVAYITDHASYDGAAEAMRANPARAGDGIVALSGIEFVAEHDHLNALGATERTDRWIHIDVPLARDHGPPPGSALPVLVQTIPENLSRLPVPAPGRPGVLAIELSDGAPRGIEQSQRDRARILRLADSLDLAVVAGSDNHGWGRTAVAWSVLRIPGWRALTPDSLGAAIEQRIRDARRHAVTVVARRTPFAGRSGLATAATLPAVSWNVLVTLSPAERISWIAWTWIAVALVVRSGAMRTEAPPPT